MLFTRTQLASYIFRDQVVGHLTESDGLDQPTHTDGKNDRMMYGACSMQGWRKTNEDAHIH